jgi:hypothetical protein
MANEYIYIPGKGTVRHYINSPEQHVVGLEFKPTETVKAQVKVPQEVVYDVRPKEDAPEAEGPPVIVEMAKSVDVLQPEKESKKKKAEKENTESKD